MESDEGCHPFIETPGVFVPNVTMLVVPVVNVNLQAKAHKLHNVTTGLHCVTILYLNLQAAKQRNPNVFLARLPHKSTLTSAIDSYSTMSSTLLEEGFPQSTVDFEGLPEICTSYFKRHQRSSEGAGRGWQEPSLNIDECSCAMWAFCAQHNIVTLYNYFIDKCRCPGLLWNL